MNKKLIKIGVSAFAVLTVTYLVTICYTFQKEQTEQREQRELTIAQGVAELEAKQQAMKLENDKKNAQEMEKKAIEFEQQQKNKPVEPISQAPIVHQDKVATDDDGNVTTTPEIPKTEPPAPPTIPEEQKKDPDKKPEYPPEETKPKPSKPPAPEGGQTNNKGEIYVPGFGWVAPPAGVQTEVINNDGWQDSERVGH